MRTVIATVLRRSRRIALVVPLVGVLVGAPVSSAAGQGTAARYTVLGSVRDAEDSRLAGAVVEILSAATTAAARRTSTGEDGAFRFSDVGAGQLLLRVRRVGFRPETLQVEVPQVDGGAVIVPLERVARPLEPVVVRSLAPSPNGALSPFAAFERRRAAGLGHFITRADIEKRRPQRTTDLLRTLPGVILEQGDAGALVPRFRSAALARRTCEPFYWVDGTPLGALTLDLDAISPSSIEGIEAYSGVATIPSTLRGPASASSCGVIAVWTRHGGPRGGPGRVSSAQLADLVDAGSVFTADQVDVPAAPLPLTAFAPAYPDSLRHVAAHVVAEFVVDARGEVEGETIGFVSATRPAFAESVRAALFDLRFAPATRRGRPVRQVVQWPVSFEPESRGAAILKTP